VIEKPIEFNSITINDGTKADLRVSPNYWIPVTSADGLFGDEVRTETHPNPCGPGEVHGAVNRSGKQLVLSGRVYALGLHALRVGELKLMEMFYDLQEHQLKFYFSPSFAQTYITCYCNQPLVIVDEWSNGGDIWRQDWTVGLRADDPTIFNVSGGTKFQSWM
jgi:hypothetical protein